MSVNIYKQLTAIAGYTVELADQTNLYTVIEDDYKLGELGGYLIDIITGTFGRDNRMPIYYALQNLSLVEVTPYANYIMTPWYKNYYSSYAENKDDFFMLYGAVILVELDEDGEETAIAHIFKARTAGSSSYATADANTYAKAHTDKRFSMYMVQWNDNNTATSMAGSAFYQCSTIVHAYIFIHGLTAITYRDFRECSNLETVDVFGASSVNIYDQAFYECRKLKRFHIEGQINRVGDSAFRYCQSLTQFDIVTPYSLPMITVEEYAFESCSALRGLPDKFWASVQYVRKYAFEYCYSLTKVGAMPNVRAIEDGAFRLNIALQTVGSSSSKTGAAKFNLGARAFDGCISLKCIYRLDTVEYLDIYAYRGCIRLESTGLKSGVWKGLSSGYSTANTLYSQHLVALKDISFVYGCTNPPDSLFACTGVTEVTRSLPFLMASMFRGCDHLTSVNLSSNITAIPDVCFCRCGRLTSVALPNTITSIGANAFSGAYSLPSISLPSNLTTIGDSAFRNCYSLEEIIIPENVTTIGAGAFTFDGESDGRPPIKLTRILIKGKHEGDISGAPWGAPSSVEIVWEADI